MRPIFIAILSACILMNCTQRGTERSTAFTSSDVEISWNLETNFVTKEGGHRATFTIKNKSNKTLGDNSWKLFWNMMPRTILQDSINGPVDIQWINGDFYTMSPSREFELSPEEEIAITYVGESAVIKRSDAPLGLYFVFYDNKGNETQKFPVKNYTIEPFDKPEQINRTAGDKVPIPTPQLRYEQNNYLTQLPENQLLHVIPSPKSIQMHSGMVMINQATVIQHEASLQGAAELLASELNDLTGSRPDLKLLEKPIKNAITLKIGASKQPEGYQLEISPEAGIVITGNDAAGVFYGTRSLLSLIPGKYYTKSSTAIELPVTSIKDQPAFAYRGLHLDVGRNFNSKHTIKKLLDVMARYKLNKFHFNLTEDEGWRIEIEELPELTEFGSYRGHTLDNRQLLQPAYGSGPFPNPDHGYGSGYYTREDYIEILQYAQERHIEVIPEINVPGHARAAILAMEYRYRKLMKEGKKEEAEAYRLIDPADTSEYLSAQWYTDNTICVCKPSAMRFIETVVDDVIEMHEEAGVPLKMFHTGGDEVPRGAWAGSPICNAFLEKEQSIDNPQNLQRYYFGKVNELLRSKGLLTGGWEEVVMNFKHDGSWTPNEGFADGQVIPYVWNSIWGNQDLGYRLANAGYPVVLCNVTNLYFDMAYDKDPEEPGLYWGGFVDARSPYEFAPFDLFKTTLKDVQGHAIDAGTYENMEHLNAAARQNIKGLQAQLWSETIKGQDTLEYYYLPKLFGLAERSWSGQAAWAAIQDPAERKAAVDQTWNSFINSVVQNELVKLDHLNGGYNYRLPVPGASVDGNRLHANVSYPGLDIRYTTDGTEPNKDSKLYEAPVDVSSSVIKLKAFNKAGRSGRTSHLNNK